MCVYSTWAKILFFCSFSKFQQYCDNDYCDNFHHSDHDVKFSYHYILNFTLARCYKSSYIFNYLMLKVHSITEAYTVFCPVRSMKCMWKKVYRVIEKLVVD